MRSDLLCKVLCGGLVCQFLCLLTHAKLRQQSFAVKLTCAERLLICLLLSGILRLLCCESLLEILPDSSVSKFLCLLLGAKRGKLRLTAKLTRLQSLLERLLLRLVLRGLCCQSSLQILLTADVVELCLFHACAKTRQSGLVGEHGA